MTTILNYEGYENYLHANMQRAVNNVQYIFKFDNNYGASIVKARGTYGYEEDLWELGVLWFDNDGEWYLCYDTEITDDVIGHLTDEEVRTYLGKIKEL